MSLCKEYSLLKEAYGKISKQIPNANTKVYLDPTRWVTHFFLIAQFDPSLNRFLMFLPRSQLYGISSEKHCVLHALCSSSEKFTLEKIKIVIETYGVDVNTSDCRGRSCVYYLRGPYLKFLLEKGARNGEWAAKDSVDDDRMEYYLPCFAYQVIDRLLCRKRKEEIYPIVERCPDRANICCEMAILHAPGERELWEDRARRFGAAIVYETPEEWVEWADRFIVRRFGYCSDERQDFLREGNIMEDGTQYQEKILTMVTSFPKKKFEYTDEDLSCPENILRLPLSKAKKYAAGMFNVYRYSNCNIHTLLTWMLVHDDLRKAVHFRDRWSRQTILHLACYKNKFPVCFVKRCIEAGANLKLRDKDGYTPLDYAKWHNNYAKIIVLSK